MTKSKIVALLSILALLAALPLTVALAQEGGEEGASAPSGPPVLPYSVVGSVMLDGQAAPDGSMVVAMVGDEEMSVPVMDGKYKLDISDGTAGDMVTFTLMVPGEMGEDGEAGESMTYEVASRNAAGSALEVMVGTPGNIVLANLMAYSTAQARPTAVPPTRTPAQERAALRGPQGPRGERGEQGEQGEPGPAGPAGPAGPEGPEGHEGHDGAAGARGPAGPAGAAGADGSDGAAGARGPAGAAGPAGPTGPAGADGATGAVGPAGAEGASGGGGLAIVALIIAIVAVVAAGGAFIAGRQSS